MRVECYNFVMKKWIPVIVLAFAQFVMVLDSTVMNVSISTVVEDLGTTVTAMQAAITFYTLTMASMMLLGGKLGDVLGRKRALIIGSIIYALGSFITAISQNFAMLFVGWSIIEGLGAILVIPAIAALTAVNYKGKDRVKAFAIIGAVAGGAAAAGPLIGGYVTTYLDWRYVFLAEVVIMAGVILCTKFIADEKITAKVPKIDIPSVLLSASGLILLVFGMLQSKTWGWIQPRTIPTINGVEIAPLGISIVAYLILAGIIILSVFYRRQQKLEAANKNPLLKVSMLKSLQLRSGLGVLLAQYLVVGAIFFIIPVYLQMTLGYDALQTGLKIMPLSIALVLASVIGARLVEKWSPKKIVRVGQYSLSIGIIFIFASINIELKSTGFLIGMFIVGAGIGLLASQIGNVNMSAVSEKESSEIGGLQGVFQNLGSSLGTAVIGSVLVGALTTAFVANVQASTLPNNVKSYIQDNTSPSVQIVSVTDVESYASSQGLDQAESEEVASVYADSQIEALRNALFILFAVSLLTIAFSRNIPDKILK
jgi:EmrB/QacA subfamily drug resistance transporter